MKRSAGLLLCRRGIAGLDVLLAHPGGPFWSRRDAGAWSIPKGELEGVEDPLAAARREFREETGSEAPPGAVVDLGEIRQTSGKVVRGFAILADFDPRSLRSNTIEIEWPPRSGRRLVVPEIDRLAWFGPTDAAERILQAQSPFLERATQAFADGAISPAPAIPDPADPGTGDTSCHGRPR